MSQKHLPTGPHAVTSEMLRRDMARHEAEASAMEEAASVEPSGGEQVDLTNEQGQFFRDPSADKASAADQMDQWPFAMSFERLKREVER